MRTTDKETKDLVEMTIGLAGLVLQLVPMITRKTKSSKRPRNRKTPRKHKR
nr:MAG TPA: hypothetical protein [Caudoviricetes sp.]